ncbi:protein-disulfide reductase DsbD N-terminal domain-containing protein, partial [bacterium]|nr:protein-disulfide reductase DsbD N-terminal domain-containing protein [bacterium]
MQRNKQILSLSALLVVILMAAGSPAQDSGFDPERDIAVEMLPSVSGFEAGAASEIAMIFHVPPDYHITSLETGLFYVTFTETEGLTFGESQFPSGKDWEGDIVYGGDVIVRTAVTVAVDAQPGEIQITAQAGYQVCVETGAQQCYFPVEKELILSSEILPAGTKPLPLNSELFGASDIPSQSAFPQTIEEEKDLATSVQEALE